MLSEGSSQGVVLIIGLSRRGRSGVEAPLGEQRFRHLARLAELEHAGLLRHYCALVLWAQPRHQLGNEPAGLLWVEVAHLLGHVDQRGDGLVVALLRTLLEGAAGTTDLNWELFTAGVSNKLAGLLLYVLKNKDKELIVHSSEAIRLPS